MKSLVSVSGTFVALALLGALLSSMMMVAPPSSSSLFTRADDAGRPVRKRGGGGISSRQRRQTESSGTAGTSIGIGGDDDGDNDLDPFLGLAVEDDDDATNSGDDGDDGNDDIGRLDHHHRQHHHRELLSSMSMAASFSSKTAAAVAVECECECDAPTTANDNIFDAASSSSSPAAVASVEEAEEATTEEEEAEEDAVTKTTTKETKETETIVLKVLTINWKSSNVNDFMAPAFEAFKADEGLDVRIDTSGSLDVVGFDALFTEIENDARLGLELFDIYLTPPTVLGSVVRYDGFADMTPYITDNYLSEWLDIHPGYRDMIATYNGKILMMPLDGDLLHLFYNKQVLEYYDLAPPRTWEEYAAIAETVHGRVFPPTNETLVGSCVGRVPQCAGPYWATLVLSSMTQARGTFEGSLFDTKDMKALTDEALLETLRIFEHQHRHGHENEFGGCVDINMAALDQGRCALTYQWGGPFLNDVLRGDLGIAKTPGSRRVLDRDTGKLVPCDRERCPYATYYEDIGFVNHVPYAAFGGWSGAVSSNIPKEKQELAMEFLAFTASKIESRKLVIPKAGSAIAATGFDPFRKSHDDPGAFIDQGYDGDTTRAYLGTIREALHSPNLAVDIRFPRATELMSALDRNIIRHLNETRGETDEGALVAKRAGVVNAVNEAWETVISVYNARGDTAMPIMEQYQRLRGVYVDENENLNLIGNAVRMVGWTLAGLVMAMSVACAGWVALNRKHSVVTMSQPIFLYVILFGVVVFSSAIFPLGVDDSITSITGCNIACASIPWLVSIGFSFIFAALFSKLWRINRVFAAAKSMKRVVITEKDVLKPFAALVTLNVVLLLSWTLADPLQWNRVQTDELNSYGRCAAKGNAWKGFISALAVLNFFALIIANVQAYMARSIKDELAESKYIGLTTLSMFQIAIVGVPLLVIVYSNPAAYFFVWTGVIFIICTSILLLIFVPKILRRAQGKKKTATPFSGASNAHDVPGLSFQQSSQGKTNENPVLSRLSSQGSVPFPDKESELVHRRKIDEIKALILEEHHIDIASIIVQVEESEKRELKAGTTAKKG